MDDLFAPEGLLVERQHDLVGNDVIDEIGPHRARITEITHLDGRGTVGENFGPAVLRVAFQVDRDVDLELVEQPGDVAIASRANIVELIERRHQTGTHLAVVVLAE